MKVLWNKRLKNKNLARNRERKMFFVETHDNELKGVTEGLIGNLTTNSEQETPLLTGNQESGSGISVADSKENFQKRVDDMVNQSVDSTISTSQGGSYLSRVLTPPEFRGFTNLYLLNPFFLTPSLLNPAGLIAKQMREGFDTIGDPASLLGDSSLVSSQMIQSLSNKENINNVLKSASRGRGNLKNISLTSLQIVERVNEESYEAISATNEDRAAEFFAKSGKNLNTGETKKGTGAVWWKKALWKGLGQNYLYRKRVKMAKNKYKDGYTEIQDNLKSIRREKEEKVFSVQQRLDRFLLPNEAAGSADTVNIARASKLAHKIIHNSSEFLRNPGGFSLEGFTAQDLFGERFIPIDALEALGAPQYKALPNRERDQDYLDSAIATNNWQINHYNSLRTLKGADTRINNLQNFQTADVNALQLHVDKNFERKKGIEINIDDPKKLVSDLIDGIGAATPGLKKDVHILINNNPYAGATELFWHLVGFLGRNLDTLDKMKPELQQEFTEFLFQKRDNVEKTLVSGGIDEPGTLIWRATALNQGKIVLEELERVKELLPHLGEEILSLEPNVANASFQKLQKFTDTFDLFKKLIGGNTLENIPELEQQMLKNVLQVEEVVTPIKTSYTELFAERKEIEKYIDQNKDWVEERKLEYERKSAQLEEVVRDGKTGFEDTHISALFSGAGDGISGEGGEGASAGLETLYTGLRKDLERLDEQLTKGDDGGAIGKLSKIANFPLKLPGNVDNSWDNLYLNIKGSLSARLQELGVTNNTPIESLYNPENRPNFEVLARLDMGKIVSDDILATTKTLVSNDALQQFENMGAAKYVGLDTLTYARAKHQTNVNIATLKNRKTLENALFVKYEDGAAWYHTNTQVIKITEPQINTNKDQRNMAIWYKSPTERGLDNTFTVPYTNPDELGIFLTANPENSAARNNKLYGGVQRKIQALEEEMPYQLAA